MKSKILIGLSLILLSLSILLSCSDTNAPEPKPDTPDVPDTPELLEQTHTLIIYMLGNNGLQKFMDANLKNINKAFREIPEGGNIVVFYDRGSYTRLMKLYINEEGDVKYDVVYDQTSTVPTTSPEFTAQMLALARECAPAETYGLVFSSHGGGWVPGEIFDRYSTYSPSSTAASSAQDAQTPQAPQARPLFIGQDESDYLEVPELVQALKDQPLEYIIFDACLMASVEALYDLRGCADHIIASSAEILGDGFPYKEMIPQLFYKGHGLENICVDYMEMYRESSGTITLVDCSELDALAAAMRDALAASNVKADASKIQHYEDFQRHLYFDLEQYAEQICDGAAMDGVRAALSRAVPFTDHTPQFYSAFGEGRYIDLPRSCGLTVHVEQPGCEDVHQAWLETSWADAIGAN